MGLLYVALSHALARTGGAYREGHGHGHTHREGYMAHGSAPARQGGKMISRHFSQLADGFHDTYTIGFESKVR